ncbi:hypothetical protein BSKO_01113 [Bryopsis sp. KO-2023]|nr:hypothetical protein BSKO_01113 [Bryopsis sp. KO-2023]
MSLTAYRSAACFCVWFLVHAGLNDASPLLLVPEKIASPNVKLVALNLDGQSVFPRIVPAKCSTPCVESTVVAGGEATPVDAVSPLEISLDIPESLPAGSYTVQLCISLECPEEALLVQQTDVYVQENALDVVVMLELDKPVYRVGQAVQIRTVCFLKDFTPCKNLDTQVTITNPEGFKVFKQKGAEGSFGVTTHEFFIIKGTALGEHKVETVASGDGFSKVQGADSFEVKEYVLPKFDAKLSLDQDFLTPTSTFVSGTVSAKYTYGKPVEGKAKAIASCQYGYDYTLIRPGVVDEAFPYSGSSNSEILDEALLDLSGSASKNFSLNLNEAPNCNQISVAVEIEEDGTGEKQEATANVRILRGGISGTMYHANEYAPGLPFTVEIEGKDELGNDANTNVKVELSSHKSSYWKNDQRYNIDKVMISKVLTLEGDGNKVVQLEVPGLTPECEKFMGMATNEDSWWASPCHETMSLTLYTDVDSEGLGGSFASSACIQPQVSTTGDYILTFAPKVYRIVTEVDVKISVYVPTMENGEKPVAYVVVGGGKILKAESASVSFSNEDRAWSEGELVVPIPEEASLLDAVDIIVGFFSAATFVTTTTSVTMGVNPQLKNDFSVEPSKTSVVPGEKLDLTVKMSPNSRAFLLAIDESVMILDDRKTQLTSDRLFTKLKGGNQDGLNTGGSSGNQQQCDATIGLSAAGIWVGGDAACGYPIEAPKCYQYHYFDEPLLDENIAFADAAEAGVARAKIQEPSAPPAPSSKPSKVRTYFPEAWLAGSDDRDLKFGEIRSVSESGTEVLSVTAPDTITTYNIFGFSTHPQEGLGITNNEGVAEQARLTIFRDVFVQLSLPFSIKLGEEVTAVGSMFNYRDEEINDATLEISGKGAVFALGDGEYAEVQQLTVDVEGNDQTSFKFQIKGSFVGAAEINLVQTSKCSSTCDGVQKSLIVKASGSHQEAFTTKMITSASMSPISFAMPDFDSLVPVEGSVFTRFSVIGDIMGPTMQNLGRLVKMPSGCGEQNMIGFSPNVFALRYMNAVGSNLPDLEATAAKFINIGYQRELQYMHKDGSFSAFGENDEEGSSWLTAFVLKCFVQAHIYTEFEADENILTLSLKYLLGLQEKDRNSKSFGAFETQGQVLHENMIGGAAGFGDSDKLFSMTAYKTITLLEYRIGEVKSKGDEYSNPELDAAITNALAFLQEKVFSETATVEKYTYVLSAFAVALAETKSIPESKRISTGFNNMDALDKIEEKLDSLSTSEGGDGAEFVFWEANKAAPGCEREAAGVVRVPYSCYKPPTSEIEMTGYALLTKLALIRAKRESPSLGDAAVLEEIGQTLPIVRWLVGKRNDLGGYSSTQDTVVALQALSEYGTWFSRDADSDIKMNLRISYDGEAFEYQEINGDTLDLLQIHPLRDPQSLKEVSLTVQGTGLAIATLHTSWYIPKQVLLTLAPENPPFEAAVSLFAASRADTRRKLQHSHDEEDDPGCIFAEYNITSTEEKGSSCGMIVAQLEHPSGYALAAEGCPASEACTSVQSIESEAGETVVYFSCIEPGSTCRVTCKLCETHEVTNRVEAEVKVYRYYNPDVEARRMVAYELAEAPKGKFDDFGKRNEKDESNDKEKQKDSGEEKDKDKSSAIQAALSKFLTAVLGGAVLMVFLAA